MPKKVGAVLPLNRLRLVDQTQVDFIDQRGRLQGLVAAIPIQVHSGKRVQLAVYVRRELVQGRTTPAAPFQQQLRS